MCQLSHNNDTRPRNRIKLWSRDFKITGYVYKGMGGLVLKIKSEKKNNLIGVNFSRGPLPKNSNKPSQDL